MRAVVLADPAGPDAEMETDVCSTSEANFAWTYP
jgi:hypothetical protein